MPLLANRALKGHGSYRPLKKSEQQIPRGLKPARVTKINGFSARLKSSPFKAGPRRLWHRLKESTNPDGQKTNVASRPFLLAGSQALVHG
jgi:hypothetical protein